jgi:hypothetical protein
MLSLPGLARQSIFRKMMDARVKPAHDELESSAAIIPLVTLSRP